MRRSTLCIVLGAAAILATTTIAAQPEAKADCVTASVWVNRYHSTPTFVVGPDQCVVWTPWTAAGGVGDDAWHDDASMSAGQPNGAGVWVRVPSPAAR